MTRPLLMLTLPNSGSTWFAAVLAKHIPGCNYYDKEFFNPVCNLKYEEVLRRNFGSELVSCYRNIATEGDDFIDDEIKMTWGKENYTFTKECQSPFKLPTFIRHFKCFAMLRSSSMTFPPGRVRVWSFYEHAWHALLAAGFVVKATSTVDRAVEAHAIMHQRITLDCKQLGVPLLEYQEIFGMWADVRASLKRVLDMPIADALVDEIVSTRKTEKRSWAAYATQLAVAD